jgi:hypothetical protein
MDEFARDTSLAGTSSPEVASSARFIFTLVQRRSGKVFPVNNKVRSLCILEGIHLTQIKRRGIE